jgi:hypothetical protein
MRPLPWTKFQDFYLRVGFLKVLAAILDPHRRSIAKEALVRRLEQILFAPAREYGPLWQQLTDQFPWVPREFADEVSAATRSKPSSKPTVTEALLLIGDCPSQLYAITPKTAYKVLDWARNLQLIGAGNQITERGLILRAMLPMEECESFLRGISLAWNPFTLSARERLFFLFHLCEVDHLTLEILEELGRVPVGQPIETSDAAKMTSRSFFQVLDGLTNRVSSADLPILRRAKELATIIARELRLEEVGSRVTTVRERVPKPKKITAHGLPWAEKHTARRTTKNADHQTIPRFEQLVDLGFLRKPCEEMVDSLALWHCRRHWRYERLPSCDAWLEERRRTLEGHGPWEWRGFASAALASGIAGVQIQQEPTRDVIAAFLWSGYLKVRRQIGHTPFHSIAMTAMIEAAVSGFAIEMRTFHDLLMAIKKQALLQEHVFFASGNEIDRMFVVIRDGFVESFGELSAEVLPPDSSKGPHGS